MATTATEIANFALAMLGSKRVSDINDTTSKNARIAKLHYDQARQEVLRSGKWNFATRRETLTQHADTPEYGYAYQYPLPSDFLRLDTVNETTVFEQQTAEWFEIENGRDTNNADIGRVLVSDAENIRILYIADIEDTQRFDPLFTQALSVLLAAKMARAITGSDGRERELREQYEMLDLPQAQQVDAAETSSGENHPVYHAIGRSALVRSRGAHGLDPLPGGPTSPTVYFP